MSNQAGTMTLSAALQAKGMTQRELAHKLGTGETQVSRWVNGLRPGAKTAERIAKHVEVEVGVLWPHLQEVEAE